MSAPTLASSTAPKARSTLREWCCPASGTSARAPVRSAVRASTRRSASASPTGAPSSGSASGCSCSSRASEEDPEVPGLGILRGSVRALASTERRPQMQWNLVHQVADRTSRLLGDGGSRWYYFVHSYVPVPQGAEALRSVVGTCDYGGEIVVAFERGNVFGPSSIRRSQHRQACGCWRAFADLRRRTFAVVTLELWPAIDIRAGKCVRLLRGELSSETVYGDPLEQAEALVAAGASLLHVVDLDAAREGGSRTGNSCSASLHRPGCPCRPVGGCATRPPLQCCSTPGSHGSWSAPWPSSNQTCWSRWPSVGPAGCSSAWTTGPLPDRTVPFRRKTAVRGWVGSGGLDLETALQRLEDLPLGGVVVTDIDRDETGAAPDLEGLARVLALTRLPVVASAASPAHRTLSRLPVLAPAAAGWPGRSWGGRCCRERCRCRRRLTRAGGESYPVP